MKKASLKSIFFLFLLIFFAKSAKVSAQDALRGRDLSDALYEALSSAGFSAEKQDLTPSETENFPQNLIVTVPKGSEDAERPWYDKGIETVVFSFTQSYAYADADKITNFMQSLVQKKLPYNAVFLFSANDILAMLPNTEEDNPYHPTGSAIYSASLGNSDSVCAIVFSETRQTAHTITPGANNDVSPRWLVQMLKECCEKLNLETNLPKNFIMLYKWGVLTGSERIANFMRQSIPAAGISIAHTSEDYALLDAIADNLCVARTERWDKHYTYIPVGSGGLWFGESFFCFSYISIGFFLLLFLSFSFFVRTSKNKALMTDIRRTCFIPPLLLALTAIFLHITQRVVLSLGGSPVTVLGVKVIVTFILTFILLSMQIRLSFFHSFGATAVHMLFIGTLNIFLFSTLNINLFFLFLLEYGLLCLAKSAQKPAAIAVTFVLPLLPLIPYAQSFLRNTSSQALRDFATFSMAKDILFAFLLLPLQLQWSRLVTSLNILNPVNRVSKRRTATYISIMISSTIILFAISYFTVSAILVKANRRLNFENFFTFQDISGSKNVTASFSEEDFMEQSMRSIDIESSKMVVRYDVSVETEGGVPLYDSNYDYSFAGEDSKVFFHIPDFPQGKIHIVYFCEQGQAETIRISAYLLDGETRGLILHENQAIVHSE